MPIVNVNQPQTAPTEEATSAKMAQVEQPQLPAPSKPLFQPQSEWSSDNALFDKSEQDETAFTAGFKSNNPIYNWGTSEVAGQQLGGEVDPNYDFLAGIRGTKYMADAEKFANTVNDQEAQQLKEQLDRDNELSTIASTSWLGTLGAVAGSIADPTILIPGIAGAKAARAGVAMAEAGIKSAGLGALAIGAQEAQLQVTQSARTVEESLFNTAAGAVLGGALGAGATALSVGQMAAQRKIVSSILKGDEVEPYIPTGEIPAAELDELHSAGAAEAQARGAQDVKFSPIFMPNWMTKKYPTVAEKLDKWLVQAATLQISGLKTPAISGLLSDSFVQRDLTSRLFNLPVQLKEQIATAGYVGKAAVEPMENRMWRDANDAAILMNSFDEHYKRFLKRTGKDPSFLKAGQERTNFMEEAMKAYNRNGVSDIPEAAELATKAREAIQRANNRMAELKLVDEESAKIMNNGDATRVYDQVLVAKDRANMRNAIVDDMNNNDLLFAARPLGERQSSVDEAIDSILGVGEEQVVLSDINRLSADKGFRATKARTIPVRNTVVEPWLVKDLSAVTNLYLHQASKLIRFQEALNEMGYESIDALKLAMKDEFKGKKMAVTRKATEAEIKAKNPGKYDDIKNTKDEKLLNEFNQKVTQAMESGKMDTLPDVKIAHEKLDTKLKKEEDMLNDNIAIALGQYSMKTSWDTALRLLRTYNATTMLGSATISSISDLAIPMMRHGLSKVLVGWEEKIRLQLIPTIKAMSNKDAEQLGMAVEYQQNSILQAMFDSTADNRLARTTVDKINKTVSTITGKLNLLEYWTSFAKDLESHIATNDIMSRLAAYSTQSNKSITFLNEHFIDEKMAKRINAQQEKYGIKNGPTYILNISNWTDEGAKNAIRAAVMKNIRGTVLTPGLGDMTYAMHGSQLGKTILQFKSFISSATGNILLRGLQQRDANVLMGITAMGLFGILSQLIKDKLFGRNTDYSISDLIKLAISNSGMLGLFGDPLFNQLVKSPVANKNAYRYQQGGMVEYLGGPSGTTINNAWKIVRDFKSGNVSDSTLKKVWKLTPYNNLFYIKGLINQLDN